MHVTVVYNGAGHPYDFNEGATLAAVFLFLKNGLNLPKLDLMRFAMGNIDVDDSPADILVSHVFSENATLSITNKSQLEGNTHMRVTVVYKGTSHAYDFNKGAPLRAVFLWMKDQLGLPDTRMRYAIAGRDSIDVGELPGDALVSSVFFENAVLSITDKPLLEGNTHMRITMVYNGDSHPYDIRKGATLAEVFLLLENELNLPKLDTMRFTMDDIDVDEMPGDIVVSNVFSENATLSITDKSLLEGNTHMRVTVVYNGASHPYDVGKRATLAAVFLCMKNELNLARLDKMRFTIAGRDNIDVGELPGDALVSSVFFENAVLSITEMFRNPIRDMLGSAVRNPIRTLESVSTIIEVLGMF